MMSGTGQSGLPLLETEIKACMVSGAFMEAFTLEAFLSQDIHKGQIRIPGPTIFYGGSPSIEGIVDEITKRREEQGINTVIVSASNGNLEHAVYVVKSLRAQEAADSSRERLGIVGISHVEHSEQDSEVATSFFRYQANAYVKIDDSSSSVVLQRTCVDLLVAIRTATNGGTYTNSLSLQSSKIADANYKRRNAELSGREKEVLGLIVDGYGNKEIAGELIVSDNTVRAHVRTIMQKLNLTNRTEVAVYAVREGLIIPRLAVNEHQQKVLGRVRYK